MADSVDVLARLIAQDSASAAVQKVERSLTEVGNAARKTSGEMRDLGDVQGNLRQEMSQFTSIITGAVSALAASEVLEVIGQFNELGDRVNDAATGFTSLGGSAGDLAALRQRTRGLVDDLQLLTDTTPLLAAGFVQGNDQAVELVSTARDLALLFGKDGTEAVQTFFDAISTGRVNELRAYGLDIERIRERIQDLGGGQEAVLRAVMEQASAIRSRNLPAIEDMVDSSARLKTQWQNIQELIGVGVNNALETTADNIVDLQQPLVDLVRNPAFQVLLSLSGQGGAASGIIAQMDAAQAAYQRSTGMGGIDQQQALFMRNSQAGIDAITAQRQQQGADAVLSFMRSGYERVSATLGEAKDVFGEQYQQVIDANTEAVKESVAAERELQRAAEENTRALERNATDIQNAALDIAHAMGYQTPNEQAQQGLEETLRYIFANNPEQVGAVLQTGEANLQRAVAAGVDVNTLNQTALERMYGIVNPEGYYNATYNPNITFGAPAQPTYNPLTGGVEQSGATWQQIGTQRMSERLSVETPMSEIAANSAIITVTNAAGYWPQVAGGNRTGGAAGSPFMIDVQANTYDPGAQNVGAQSPFVNPYNYPNAPAYNPQNAGAISPYAGGGMDYSNLPAYDSSQMAQDVTMIADQSGIAADNEHLGAWPTHIQAADQHIQHLQQNVDQVASTHQITFDVVLNQSSRDRLSEWVFSILRSAGVNLASNRR